MQLVQKRRTPAQRRGGNNGGFPEPPSGDPFRVVHRAHPACGAETEIRLPEILSERIIQRVICNGCEATYEPAPAVGEPGPGDGRRLAAARPPVASAAAVFGASGSAAAGARPDPAEAEEYGPIAARLAPAFGAVRDRTLDLIDAGRDRFAAVAGGGSGSGVRGRLPGLSGLPRPDLPKIPRSRLWAWASVPLAALGVIVGLALIQGDSSPPAAPTAAGESAGAGETRFIDQPGYSLALPAGWKKINPPDGAVFAAESRDGTGDATLWIEEDPSLTLKQFETRSVSQLEEIADNVRVADRVNAPTIEGSIVELRADTPIAEGVSAPYRVTLRGAGPFRHYLATAQQPGADPGIAADIELMHNSLRPEVELEGLGSEGGS